MNSKNAAYTRIRARAWSLFYALDDVAQADGISAMLALVTSHLALDGQTSAARVRFEGCPGYALLDMPTQPRAGEAPRVVPTPVRRRVAPVAPQKYDERTFEERAGEAFEEARRRLGGS